MGFHFFYRGIQNNVERNPYLQLKQLKLSNKQVEEVLQNAKFLWASIWSDFEDLYVLVYCLI